MAEQVLSKIERKKLMLLDFCLVPRSRAEMMEHIDLTNVKSFRTNYLIPMQKDGLIQKVDPDTPTSRNQKYVTTQKYMATQKYIATQKYMATEQDD